LRTGKTFFLTITPLGGAYSYKEEKDLEKRDRKI
jgi:hypothetical protein